MLEEKNQNEKLIQKKRMSDEKDNVDEQYIFYNQKKKFTNKIELDVMLKSNNATRVMILIDIKSTLNFLSVKIADYMEHFPEYSNLEGLKAINITKKTEKGLINIPESGEIKEFLENGSILYCDLKTDEFWIKTSLNMISGLKKLSISLDIKNRMEMPMKKLKMLIIKTGLNFWIDYCKDDDFHYIIVDAKCRTLRAKQNLEFDIEDLAKNTPIDEMLIRDVFDFKSEIICNFTLISIEELIFNELKKYKSLDFGNKFKFDDFQQTNFYEFISSKKFEDELKTIQKLIVKSLKNHISDLKGNIYCYNKATLTSFSNNISISNEGGFSSSIIILPSKVKRLKILKSVNEEDELEKVPERIKYNNIPEFKYNVKSFNKENRNYHINTELSPNPRLTISNSSFLENIRRSTIDNEGKIITNSIKRVSSVTTFLPFKANDSKGKSNINAENDMNANIDSNIINNRKTYVIIEEEKEDDQINLKNNLNQSKIISQIKVCDYDEGFPVLSSDPEIMLKKSPNKSPKKMSLRNLSNKCLTLSSEISSIVTLDKFNMIIDSFVKLKICKVSLEKITMPQFRNVKMNSVINEDSPSRNFANSEFNNKKVAKDNRIIIFFVFCLILLFIIIVVIVLFFNK